MCRTCGLVAHERIPTDAELDRYYASDYRRDYHGELTPSPRRVMRAWRNGERIHDQVRGHVGVGSVIEIGAGIGCTVKVFEQAGWHAEGIDPNVGFLGYSHERLHAPMHVGTVASLEGHEPVDLVLLVHVIEHFRSPMDALRRIRALLPTGKHLYVECPNLAAPFAAFPRLFHFAHIHNFTPTTLEAMAAIAGFRRVTRFGDDRDPNLQVLFRADEPLRPALGGGVAETRDALARSKPLRYHLRLRYLADRARKVWSYARERVLARRFVAELEARCVRGALLSA